jgi:tetratricopeptide (TPR) repeat protein
MRRDWQIMALLAAATFAVFWQVSRHEFVNFDDPAYVTYNSVVREGLTWPGVAWAFTNLHGEATYWHPVTWLSHMLDCQLFGLKASGHHLTSLFLHTLNTLLLFVLLRRMTGRRGPSAMVAALFALHPLQVDSVAWIAERKNVLSAFFFMLTLWTYARYAEGRRAKAEGLKSEARSPKAEGTPKSEVRGPKLDAHGPWSLCHWPFFIFYSLSLLFFALGLMSKPTLVPLPFLLLLLDYWPLGSMQNEECSMQKEEVRSRLTSTLRSTAMEDGHHVSRFTFHDLRLTLLPLLVEKLPFLLLTAVSCLVTLRGHESLGALASTEELPIGLRLANAVVACALYLRKLVWPTDLSVFYLHPGRWPALWVAASALLVLGLTALAVWQARRRPYLIVGWLWFLGMLVPVIGLVQAHVQALADRFAYVPVIGVFIMAVWAAAEWLAVIIAGNHRWTCLPLLRCGLVALVLAGCVVTTSLQLRYWRNSITLLQRAVQVEPANFRARLMLGNALFERRQLEVAAREYQAALRLRPDYAEAWLRTGVALTEEGRPAEAMPYLVKAGELAPGWPEPQRRLALALLRQGRLKEAHEAYQKLVPSMPATAEGYRDLADMLAEGQQYAEALHYYCEALRLNPDFDAALNNLAMFRASCKQPEFRNGQEAVQLAQAACRLSGRRNPSYLGTLAAAYAEAGQFGDAVKTIQEALALARASGANELIPIQTQMLQQFRAGKPYR